MEDINNESLARSFLRKTWVKLIIGADILIAIILLCAAIINSYNTTLLKLDITPTDATISINGDTKYRNGLYKMHPGKYEIDISKSGMNSKHFSLEIDSKHHVNITTFLSTGEGDFSYYDMKGSEGDYEALVNMASAGNNITYDHDTSAEEYIANYNKKMQIFNMLPIRYENYDAGYSNYTQYEIQVNYKDNLEGYPQEEKCSRVSCLLIVDGTGDNKENAYNKIREYGFDPDDYEIKYDYQSIYPVRVSEDE